MSFGLKAAWGINCVTQEKFSLPQLDAHIDMKGGTLTIGRYYLFPLAAAGQPGVERALALMQA